MTTFQVERWSDALPELRPLFALLWNEVALDKQHFRAECNEPLYDQLEKNGMIHLVTVREGARLVGYFVAFVMTHGHYFRAGKMAMGDMYFLLPEFRKGLTGMNLIRFMEKSLRARGDVEKAYIGHKVKHDRGPLFERLGWTPCDVLYSKVLL